MGDGEGGGGGPPPVTEKAFDEYHLYSLVNPTTLHDRELKQVEFVRTEGATCRTLYVYDGAKYDPNPQQLGFGDPRTAAEYGTQCNGKVWILREFTNSAANHLGLPLPKGTVRFYRRNSDGQLEFTGEDTIEHTPKDEIIRLNTGNAFDLVGERKQTEFSRSEAHPFPFPDYTVDPNTGAVILASSASTNAPVGPWVAESFEIRLRNHKKESVEVRVIEHLYRWNNWKITQQSDPSRKMDSTTVEFPVLLKSDEEKTLTYTVQYWWW